MSEILLIVTVILIVGVQNDYDSFDQGIRLALPDTVNSVREALSDYI